MSKNPSTPSPSAPRREPSPINTASPTTFKYVIPMHSLVVDGAAPSGAEEVAALNIGDVVAYGAFGKTNKWKWTLGSVIQLTYTGNTSTAARPTTNNNSLVDADYATPPRLSGSTPGADNSLPTFVTVRDFVLTKQNEKENSTRRIVVTNVRPECRSASNSRGREGSVEGPGMGEASTEKRKVRFTANVSSNTFPYYGAFAVLRNKDDHFQHVLRKKSSSVRRSTQPNDTEVDDGKKNYEAEDVLWLAKEELEEFYKLAALHRARMEVSQGMSAADVEWANSLQASSASPTPFKRGYVNAQQCSSPPSAVKNSSQPRDLTAEVEAAATAAPLSEPLLITAVALDMFYNERYHRQTIQLQEMEQRYAAVFQFNRGKDVVASLHSTSKGAAREQAYKAFTDQLEMLLLRHKEAVARAEVALLQMDEYLRLLTEFYNEKYDVLHLAITHENYETIEQLRFFLRQKQRSHIKATDILQNTLTDVLENPQNYYQSIASNEQSGTASPVEHEGGSRSRSRARSASYATNSHNRLLTIVQQMERAIEELGDDGCEYALPSATPLPPNLRYDLRKQYNQVASQHGSRTPSASRERGSGEKLTLTPSPLRGHLPNNSPSPVPQVLPATTLQEQSPPRADLEAKGRCLSVSSRHSNNNNCDGDELEPMSVSASTRNTESRNTRTNSVTRNAAPAAPQEPERKSGSNARRAESEERYRTAENAQREMVFQILQNIADLDKDLIAADKQTMALEETMSNTEMSDAERLFIKRRVDMLRKEMQVLLADKESKIQQVQQLNHLLTSFNDLLAE